MLADAEEKRRKLSANGIAVYDAVYECDISGSSDASAFNIVPADLGSVIKIAKIERILCNGSLAYSLTLKYNPGLNLPVLKMPSTSPANAAVGYSELEKIWLSAIGGV